MTNKLKIAPFKLNENPEHCGKSTVDGSYVKGVYKKHNGTHKISGTPVHPWSIGVIINKN